MTFSDPEYPQFYLLGGGYVWGGGSKIGDKFKKDRNNIKGEHRLNLFNFRIKLKSKF